MQKTALITGSTGGIGSAAIRQLADRGYRLILLDLEEAGLQRMKDQYPDAETHALDLANSEAVAAFCDRIAADEWQIDMAFVNAGVLVIGDLAEITPEQLNLHFQVNLVAASQMIQALAVHMARRRQGHIMATVSMGGIVSLKGSTAYSASKFGLRGLLWGLRDELSSKGVHVTGIYPAGVDTPMLRREALHGGSALNFVGKPVTPDDVARGITRALDRPRLEVYVPYAESISSRFVAAFPGMLTKLYPVLERIGERGRSAYLKRIAQAES